MLPPVSVTVVEYNPLKQFPQFSNGGHGHAVRLERGTDVAAGDRPRVRRPALPSRTRQGMGRDGPLPTGVVEADGGHGLVRAPVSGGVGRWRWVAAGDLSDRRGAGT